MIKYSMSFPPSLTNAKFVTSKLKNVCQAMVSVWLNVGKISQTTDCMHMVTHLVVHV